VAMQGGVPPCGGGVLPVIEGGDGLSLILVGDGLKLLFTLLYGKLYGLGGGGLKLVKTKVIIFFMKICPDPEHSGLGLGLAHNGIDPKKP
jgi:hypothetical protein